MIIYVSLQFLIVLECCPTNVDKHSVLSSPCSVLLVVAFCTYYPFSWPLLMLISSFPYSTVLFTVASTVCTDCQCNIEAKTFSTSCVNYLELAKYFITCIYPGWENEIHKLLLQLFLHRIFGYRGVVLFPWVAKLYDRDLQSNTDNDRYNFELYYLPSKHTSFFSIAFLLPF